MVSGSVGLGWVGWVGWVGLDWIGLDWFRKVIGGVGGSGCPLHYSRSQ